jgi:hypothetical protein
MNNHKSVTISILHFLKHDKNVILHFLENMHKKTFRIWLYARKQNIFLLFF